MGLSTVFTAVMIHSLTPATLFGIGGIDVCCNTTYGVRFVILYAIASDAGYLQMDVLRFALATYCLSRDELRCGIGSLQNIKNNDIRNKVNGNIALLAVIF